MSVNKVILVGRLGADPEMKFSAGGAGICNFSLATTEKWTGRDGQKQEKTEWHRIVVFNKLAEVCNQYAKKGSQLYVEGKINTKPYQDKNGETKYSTQIVADQVRFLNSKPKGESAPPVEDNSQFGGTSFSANPAEYTQDEIPF